MNAREKLRLQAINNSIAMLRRSENDPDLRGASAFATGHDRETASPIVTDRKGSTKVARSIKDSGLATGQQIQMIEGFADW